MDWRVLHNTLVGPTTRWVKRVGWVLHIRIAGVGGQVGGWGAPSQDLCAVFWLPGRGCRNCGFLLLLLNRAPGSCPCHLPPSRDGPIAPPTPSPVAKRCLHDLGGATDCGAVMPACPCVHARPLQPEEELVQDEESGAVDADVGVVFTAAVTKGGKSLVWVA